MVEPGLSSRLKQHSRRSGMLVGLSMAVTIAICIAAFIWIYLRVGPFLSDFIPADTPTRTSVILPAATPTTVASVNASPSAQASPGTASLATPAATPTPIWEATHRIAEGAQINFRAGPSTVSDILGVLQPRTPLKFLGEQRSSGGATWMRFQTQQGVEGWVRSIDVTTISP